MKEFKIHKKITIRDVQNIISGNLKISLSEEARVAIGKGRNYLDKRLSKGKEAIYGINTGFGALHNVRISGSEIELIQENLLQSHACGMGDEVPPPLVKIMLLLKIQGLSYGKSGINLETVERLILFFNCGVMPVVYQQGSLGASGDLAPLAHLSLPLIGMGDINYNGKKHPAAEALKKLNLKPLRLRSKEGLALLNGTQFMSAYGVWILIQAQRLSLWADFIAALSIDAFDCKPDPFDPLLQDVRPFPGQIKVASRIREFLKGSPILNGKKEQVQDPYSFRCIPQVHGASADVLEFAEKTFLTEINSVTDNPTIFPEEDKIVSGGNFHGQPLALSLDFLAIALAELANISERRIFQLISGHKGLPLFLTKNPGPHSGFMVPQYTAASIVSQNKQLCTPASVDSIVSSNGQEDHVSMGANAATKCFSVLNNLEKVLAIELFTAAQALEFKRPLRSSPQIESVIAQYRKTIPFIEKDTIMKTSMDLSVEFIRNTPTRL